MGERLDPKSFQTALIRSYSARARSASKMFAPERQTEPVSESIVTGVSPRDINWTISLGGERPRVSSSILIYAIHRVLRAARVAGQEIPRGNSVSSPGTIVNYNTVEI